MIASYNASAERNYNATSSLVRFENKNILFYFGNRTSLPTIDSNIDPSEFIDILF
jgi:hypothetical protein